ncbi:relaxase/mobilization nuclease domain-containing protein [Sphingobium olei]|uniref:Relaxase/mobilization nuclease domain-containing protein n=1 Tax=Sphingobium olei TaxID=420955 RepID=A0ABW3NTT5_9SPHN
MIGKSIGLNNRRARRAIDRELRRKGLPATIVSPEQVRGRAAALTDYLRDADPTQLRRLELAGEESHAALVYIADVAATIAELQRVEPGEKVDVIGFRNFRSDDFVRCQREMIATMMRSPGIDPLEHYVLAWQGHEQPTAEQVHQVAEIFLDAMGLSENQAIYAAHSNTANYHLHIAANRVHPKTHQRIAAGGDWQVDMIHQAVAMIEHEQGWASEPNALYRANEHGVFHNETGIQVRDVTGITGRYPSKEQRAESREASAAEKEKLPIEEQLSEGARAYERRTQLASFERLAKTVVKPILRTARSWFEVHQRLAEQGFEYETGGSGARIRWADSTLAASTADRSAALGQMEKRSGFGPFIARDPSVDVVERRPMSLTPDKGPERYWAERQTYATGVETLKAHLQSQRAAIEQSLVTIQDCMSADIIAVGWANTGTMLNVARGVVGHEHRRLTTVVVEQFRAAAKALPTLQNFPTLAAWSAGASAPVLPSLENMTMPTMLMSPGYGSAPLPIDVPGYRRVAVGRAFHHLDEHGNAALRDLGDLLMVDHADKPEAVRAALLLAQKKWGSVSIVSGDAAFRDLCARLAMEEGVTLTNEAAPIEATSASRDAQLPLPIAESGHSIIPTPDQLGSKQMTAEPRMRSPDFEPVSIYGDFPFLHDPPDDADDRTARQFVGLNPFVDAWLIAHGRDAQDFVRLRPLASRIMHDDEARAVVTQMQAEGCSEADRIAQQAQFHQRQQAALRQVAMHRS